MCTAAETATSPEGKPAGASTTWRNTAAAKTSSGKQYAGHDGNVYKNTGNGWQKYDNGSWNSVNKPQPNWQGAQNSQEKAGSENSQQRTSSASNADRSGASGSNRSSAGAGGYDRSGAGSYNRSSGGGFNRSGGGSQMQDLDREADRKSVV